MDIWINFAFFIIGAEVVLISKEFFIFFKEQNNIEKINNLKSHHQRHQELIHQLTYEIKEKDKSLDGLNFLWTKSLNEIEILKNEIKKAEKQMLHLAQKSIQNELPKSNLPISYWESNSLKSQHTIKENLDSVI